MNIKIGKGGSGKITIGKENVTKLKSGSFHNQEESTYIFRSATNNTLAQIFNPTQFEAYTDSLTLYDINFNQIGSFFTDGSSWLYDDFTTIADNYVLPANAILAFGTTIDFDIIVGGGAIIQKYYNSGKTNQRKYIDLLPPNFISKVTLSGGLYGNGVYTRSSGGTTTFNGPGSNYIQWLGNEWGLFHPEAQGWPEDPGYRSSNLINWTPDTSISPSPVGITENALSFLFDPIFYKSEIQNERHQILVQGCSLPYVNGIYSQTVDPSLVSNRPYFIKDDDINMRIYFDTSLWIIEDQLMREYGQSDLFYKPSAFSTSFERPHNLDWSTPQGGSPDGGVAYDDGQTPPTITEYLNLTESLADLDPVYLEELRNYQIDNIVPTLPTLDVRQHIPGAPFNSRKAELRNNVYRYIKYNNNDDVEHLKTHGKIIYNTLTQGASDPRNKNLQDLIQPLLKLRKNNNSTILNSYSDFTLNMFVKLQRPVSHTAPGDYLVREKRGIFFTSYEHKSRAFILGYRSPYYNIDGDTTYKLKFEPFSFVFSFGHGWTSDFGYGNFTLMTDYKYKFGEMYMLSISKQDGEYKIYINGELQTVAMLPFNPCVLPSSSNSRSRRQHNARMQITPLAPGFLQKDGSTYSYTSTSWTPENVGFISNYLCFGKSRRSGADDLGSGKAHHHRRKRYLNNLDIGVINAYNIALSQSQISEMYNNFRYRYI